MLKAEKKTKTAKKRGGSGGGYSGVGSGGLEGVEGEGVRGRWREIGVCAECKGLRLLRNAPPECTA